MTHRVNVISPKARALVGNGRLRSQNGAPVIRANFGLDRFLDSGPSLTERLGVEIQQALEVELVEECLCDVLRSAGNFHRSRDLIESLVEDFTKVLEGRAGPEEMRE